MGTLGKSPEIVTHRAGEATIYRTVIFHARTHPLRYSFRHESCSWYVDVENLPQIRWWLRWVAQFRYQDHLFSAKDPQDSWRSRVEETLRHNGIEPPQGRITALLNARCLGYVFDPLTIFWCHDEQGNVKATIAEVHNTYGGRHSYVVPYGGNTQSRVDKKFYVSPFHPKEGSYRLRLPEPSGTLAIDIVLDRPNATPFVATWRGVSRSITTREIFRSQLWAPFLVALRIRYHGIRLYFKGLSVQPRDYDVSSRGPHDVVLSNGKG